MFLGKEVRVFLKGQAKESYIELKKRNDKESVGLIKSVERIISILKTNAQFGNLIKKESISEQFLEIGIKNFYRVELSNYWRMIYTISGNQIDILVFILNIVDHPTYDKIFGYKKR